MIQNESFKPLHRNSLGKCLLFGGGIACSLVVGFFLFLYIVAGPGPEVAILSVPVLTVTLAGIAGGVVYYLMDFIRWYGGWKRVVANVLSGIFFGILVFFSFIFGLAQIGLWD